MNVALLQEIKAHILAEPEAFRMDVWSCGTAHCIAGWALKLSGTPIINPDAPVWKQVTWDGGEPSHHAAALLRLDEDDESNMAGRLFSERLWPTAFMRLYRAADSYAERASIAAERIDHFIATEGRE